MATRSYIGVQKGNKIEFVYCHYDGYVNGGVGEELFRYFNSQELAEKLVSGGDMSYLEDGVAKYYTDMGESFEQNAPRKIKIGEEDEHMLSEDYAYLFKDGKWYFSKGMRKKGNWKPVEAEL